MKKTILALILLFGFFFNGLAQKYDYDKVSKYYIGLNIGHTWHSSDVKNIKDRFPLGGGIIVGRTFNRDYGKLLSFDLRLRYLGGAWYGLDRDTTNALGGNIALGELYNDPGYAVQNFKSVQHSLDLELAIHLNRATERSGLDPYIFGGIGMVGTKTRGALLTDPDVDVKGIDYSIYLDKNADGEPYESDQFHTQILPSLGIGLGYYFNSNIALGIEHRSTFFRGDYFDGTTVKQNGKPSTIKNDIYHYTSIYFKWYFNVKDKKEIPPVDVDPTTDIIHNEKRPPVVHFTNPGQSNTTTQNSYYQIMANVQFVTSSNNVTFTQNGRQISTFSFNPSTGVFQSHVTLDAGQNVFTITGVNIDGTDNDQTVIIYEEKKELPPIVNIVDPISSPHTTNQLNYIIQADIQNIKGRNQLAVTFNQQPFTNFSFTPNGTVNFSANVSLQPGVNTFTIVGTNEVGSDSDNTVIIYNRQPNDNSGFPPVVTITKPSVSPYTTYNPIEIINAKVDNVLGKHQIAVKINGVNTSSFTYNTNTHIVQLSAVLELGSNIVTVTGTNDYGMDMAQTQIIYRKQTPEGVPPTVTITTPAQRPFTVFEPSTNVVAKVNNIDTKNQITVKINGVNTSNFTFNNSTHLVQLNVPLVIGSNIVSILGTNNFGSDMDETQIIYRKPPTEPNNPPVVTITTPSTSPTTVYQNTQNIVASVLHVTSKNQITVKVNGNSVTNFTFNANLVQFNANLIVGQNDIVITATNNYGSDSDQTQVIYKVRQQLPPPIVNITKPNVNPYATQNQVEHIIASVENVTQKSQIEVKINGTVTTNFTFNQLLKQVDFNASLNIGSNSIVVTATNEVGSDSDNTIIRVSDSNTNQEDTSNASGFKPNVTITIPSERPYTTTQSSQNVVAKVSAVVSKQQIDVKINGVSTSNFTFTISTKEVSFVTPLNMGSNLVKVIATNNFGSGSDETMIIRQKEETVDPPLVSFISPSTPNTQTTTSNYNMVAKVEGDVQKSGITVKFNNQTVNQNNFTYNAQTKTVQYPSKLKLGKNTFVVSATNEGGSHQASTDINYKLGSTTSNDDISPCKNHPSIKFTSPQNAVSTTTSDTYKIIANLVNIDNKNQITVFLNGVKMTNFVFDASLKILYHTINLNEGQNTYKVVLKNDCSEKAGQITINYDAPSCGVQIDVSNKAEFCFETPSGKITVNYLLANPNYTYQGNVTNLYFKAVNNGIAKVGSNDYPIVKDNFYKYTGTVQVNLKRENNKWILCVESIKKPLFGKGSNKPENPCALQEIDGKIDKGSNKQDGKKQIDKGKINNNKKTEEETPKKPKARNRP